MFTWGSPILGGYISQTTDSVRNQLTALSIIQAFAIFIIFLVPETSFDRSNVFGSPGTMSAFGPSAISTQPELSFSPFKAYLNSVHSLKYTTLFALRTVLQPIRALSAPSALLAFLLTGPMTASSSIPNNSSSSAAFKDNYGEMLLQPAHAVLENILIGVFIIGVSSWVQGSEVAMEGIKDTVVALAVLQIVLASTAGALLFAKGDRIRAVDRRVLGIGEEGMRRLGLQGRKSDGSSWKLSKGLPWRLTEGMGW